MITETEKIKIINYYKLGMTMEQISEMLKISKCAIIRWLKRYIETGTLEIKHKKDTKRKTSKEEDVVLYNIANNKDKFRLNILKNELSEKNILISKTTIWRRLKDKDYLFGRGISKPKMSEKQKQKRLEWAISQRNTDWSKVNFSDEATVYLNNENKFYWYM